MTKNIDIPPKNEQDLISPFNPYEANNLSD